jgi:hypothetical protein
MMYSLKNVLLVYYNHSAVTLGDGVPNLCTSGSLSFMYYSEEEKSTGRQLQMPLKIQDKR